MFWKNWSHWLKGGIIGLIYFLIAFMIETIFGNNPLFIDIFYSKPTGWEGLFFVIAFYPIFILVDRLADMFLLFIQNSGYKINALILETYFLISAISIGAFIGLIYGKIKNRK